MSIMSILQQSVLGSSTVVQLMLVMGIAMTMTLTSSIRQSIIIVVDEPLHMPPNQHLLVHEAVQWQANKSADVAPRYMSLANASCTPVAQLAVSATNLQFIHIPKTDGSSIELVAAKNKIAWGICHWTGHVKKRPACPPHPERVRRHAKGDMPYWHMPPQHISGDAYNPYNQHPETRVFVIVRDPYSRIVSDWNYYPWIKVHVRNNATAMNAFIQTSLRNFQDQPDKFYFSLDGHLIPQYDYIKSFNASSVHVLRMEHMTEEFNCLMKQYNLKQVQLSANKRTNGRKQGATLTIHNLTVETKRLLQQVYADDFAIFGYDV